MTYSCKDVLARQFRRQSRCRRLWTGPIAHRSTEHEPVRRWRVAGCQAIAHGRRDGSTQICQ